MPSLTQQLGNAPVHGDTPAVRVPPNRCADPTAALIMVDDPATLRIARRLRATPAIGQVEASDLTSHVSRCIADMASVLVDRLLNPAVDGERLANHDPVRFGDARPRRGEADRADAKEPFTD